MAIYHVRSTRNVNMPPHPTPCTPPHPTIAIFKNVRFTGTVFGPQAKTSMFGWLISLCSNCMYGRKCRRITNEVDPEIMKSIERCFEAWVALQNRNMYPPTGSHKMVLGPPQRLRNGDPPGSINPPTWSTSLYRLLPEPCQINCRQVVPRRQRRVRTLQGSPCLYYGIPLNGGCIAQLQLTTLDNESPVSA